MQTKLVYKRTQSIALKGSIGTMKRQTDTRNYSKIQLNKPFANCKR